MQETIELDGFDTKLLAALQNDGRLANQDLADKVGLSASQCSRRRTRLEALGLIAGYHARLDERKLGFGVIAFIQVTLARHSRDNARRFAELIAREPAIQQAFAVTGDADYLLRVIATDLAALSRLVSDILLAHESVAQVRSSIALDRLKDTLHVPAVGR